MVLGRFFQPKNNEDNDSTPWWEQVADNDPEVRQQGHEAFTRFADAHSPQYEEDDEDGDE